MVRGDGDGGNEKGEMGRGQRRGRRGSWQRGRAEEGGRGGGISHMKCLGGHMEYLGGTRLQIFLTLFTRATPGTPASSAGTIYRNTGNIAVCQRKNGYRFLNLLPIITINLL